MSEQSGIEWPGQGGGCGECVRVHRYTMSKQSGKECETLQRGSKFMQAGAFPPSLIRFQLNLRRLSRFVPESLKLSLLVASKMLKLS